MKKITKILLLVLVFYLAIGLTYWIIGSYYQKHSNYLTKLSYYEKEKTCYECFSGKQTGICPKIETYSSIKSYPLAKETTSTNPKELLHKCIWYSTNNIEDGFRMNVPEENYISFLFENWKNSWEGYFFMTLGVPFMLITGLSM